MKNRKNIKKKQNVKAGIWKKFLVKVSGRGFQTGRIERRKVWTSRKVLWRG